MYARPRAFIAIIFIVTRRVEAHSSEAKKEEKSGGRRERARGGKGGGEGRGLVRETDSFVKFVIFAATLVTLVSYL